MTTTDPSQRDYSWEEMANLTHETQVATFGWCACEDDAPMYDDCPTNTVYKYEVSRDNETLAVFDTEVEAMRYLLRIQPRSMMWACEHDGYALSVRKERP